MPWRDNPLETSTKHEPASTTATVTLPARPEQLQNVRAWLQRHLPAALPARNRAEIVLAVGELAGNSIEHSGSPEVTIIVAVSDATPVSISVTVMDTGPGLPAHWPIPGSNGRGRGLFLASMFSTRLTHGAEQHTQPAMAWVRVDFDVPSGPAS